MAVFTYTPDFGAQKSIRPNVTNLKFGDGYTQRVAFGLNTQLQSWALSFTNRDAAEADLIETFLIDKNGVESFDWTPPGEASPRKFICQSWSRTKIKGGFDSISATFEETADL